MNFPTDNPVFVYVIFRRGLEALVDEGLVAALGLSNCSLAQVEEVLAAAKHKPVCNQVGRGIMPNRSGSAYAAACMPCSRCMRSL
jgi:diketogulonate reductase-like aldo/keto reductase